MPAINNPSIAIGRTLRFQILKYKKIETQKLQSAIDQAESDVVDFSNDAKQAKQAVDGLPNSIQNLQLALSNTETLVTGINNSAGNAKKTVDSLSSGLVSLGNEVSKTHGVVEKLYQKSEQAETIVEHTFAQSSDVLKILIRVREKLDGFRFDFPDDFPESRLDELWICERTLHRVEQLVTDEKPDEPKKYDGQQKRDNNEQLKHIQSDSLTTKCIEILKAVSAVNLADEIVSIHEPFKHVKNSLTKERYDRFIQIQRLRQKIVICLLEAEKK
jgi:hypothetical protein